MRIRRSLGGVLADDAEADAKVGLARLVGDEEEPRAGLVAGRWRGRDAFACG
jgi:hypothetical protein